MSSQIPQEQTEEIQFHPDLNDIPELDTLPLIGIKLNPQNKPSNEIESNFLAFIKNICCPSFSFISTTFILSFIQVLLYIVILCFGIRKDPLQLLAPKLSLLNNFGTIIQKNVRKGEIWRFVTAVFFHSNLYHLFYNVLSQIILGSNIEIIFNQFQILVLYFLCLIFGGIFSCCLYKKEATESSQILFALIGFYLAFNVLNFNYIEKKVGFSNKIFTLIFCVALGVLNTVYALSDALISVYGNFGSLIFGFLFSMVLIKPYEKNDGLLFRTKIWFWIGLSCSVFFFILEIILFFTFIKA